MVLLNALAANNLMDITA